MSLPCSAQALGLSWTQQHPHVPRSRRGLPKPGGQGSFKQREERGEPGNNPIGKGDGEAEGKARQATLGLGVSVPLPARIQRILSMVRADLKLPPCPCSLPVSLFPELGSSSSQGCCCPLVFLFPPGRSGRAGEAAGLPLLRAGIWDGEGITRGDGHVFVLYQLPRDHSGTG